MQLTLVVEVYRPNCHCRLMASQSSGADRRARLAIRESRYKTQTRPAVDVAATVAVAVAVAQAATTSDARSRLLYARANLPRYLLAQLLNSISLLSGAINVNLQHQTGARLPVLFSPSFNSQIDS